MRLGKYVKMSTANPTGWRPWQSRLQGLGSFYLQNSFPLPTTGRGPWLLQPGVCDCVRPTVNGGLGMVNFPNYPGIGARGTWITHGGYPAPIYRPPAPPQLSGLGRLGAVRSSRVAGGLIAHRAPITVTPATPSGTAVARSNGSTSTATGTAWRNRGGTSSRSRGRGSYNPTQAPGYVVGSDASGNPIYAQPPTGQIVTGYDAQGNPIYGPATSTVGTGGVVQSGYSAAGTITGYDSSGNPIYSSAPAGATITGYDANGNPIYSTGAAAAASSTSWFSEDSLGLGLNNGIYAIIGVGLVLIFKKR